MHPHSGRYLRPRHNREQDSSLPARSRHSHRGRRQRKPLPGTRRWDRSADLPLGSTSDAEAALSQTRPDIAQATQNGIEEILPIVKQRCLEHGADVITIAGDAYFPSIDSHQAAAGIDALALFAENNLGTGVQDVFWDNPCRCQALPKPSPAFMAAACALADEYGDWVLKALQIGASPAAVAKSALHPFSSALIGLLQQHRPPTGLSVTHPSNGRACRGETGLRSLYWLDGRYMQAKSSDSRHHPADNHPGRLRCSAGFISKLREVVIAISLNGASRVRPTCMCVSKIGMTSTPPAPQ